MTDLVPIEMRIGQANYFQIDIRNPFDQAKQFVFEAED